MTMWHVCPLKTPLKWCSECRWGLDLPIPAAFAALGIWQCQVGSGWQFLVQQFPFVLTPDPCGSSEHSKPRVSPCLYSPVTDSGWTLGRDLTFTVSFPVVVFWREGGRGALCEAVVSHICINRSAEHIGSAAEEMLQRQESCLGEMIKNCEACPFRLLPWGLAHQFSLPQYSFKCRFI